MERSRSGRLGSLVVLSIFAVILGGASALVGVCGPFSDVTDAQFCPFVLEIFTLGITTGTTPTTYDPASPVSRLQMAAFLSRSVDGVLNRGSRRAALDQFWTTWNDSALGVTTVGSAPMLCKSDGADVWVPNYSSHSVSRVRGSDGKLLETWTGATSASAVVVALGRVFVSGRASPGRLYRIDPREPAGAVTTVASNLGNMPGSIAFDGSRVWTANLGGVSIVTPSATIPWTVTTVALGFNAVGLVYDGANIWATTPDSLLKLGFAGAVLQTVTIGSQSGFPAFDGANLWVPNTDVSSLSVVRASSGAILQTLTGNGLDKPMAAAFDGQRVLVTNLFGDSVSLWKAADRTPLGVISNGGITVPYGACSDGVNFWITLNSAGRLVRF